MRGRGPGRGRHFSVYPPRTLGCIRSRCYTRNARGLTRRSAARSGDEFSSRHDQARGRSHIAPLWWTIRACYMDSRREKRAHTPLGAIITALLTMRQDPVTVNVNTIDPAALIDAIDRMPTDRVLRGDADRSIADAVRRAKAPLPPKQRTNAILPGQGPKRDKPPSRPHHPRKRR
jgi:hypothetical protein